VSTLSRRSIRDTCRVAHRESRNLPAKPLANQGSEVNAAWQIHCAVHVEQEDVIVRICWPRLIHQGWRKIGSQRVTKLVVGPAKFVLVLSKVLPY